MNEIISIFSYFIIYSFLGWILESVYKTIYQKKLVNSGFLLGPVCPIYGVGTLILYFVLKGFKGNAIIVFCLGFVVLSVWEYLVSIFLEKVFHTTYWDYSENKYNLHGRICLKNSCFWGILSIVFIYFVHPFIQKNLSLINNNILIYIDCVIFMVVVVDTITTVVKIIKIESNLEKIEELNIKIKEKLQEIKEIRINSNINTTVESAKDILESLKIKRNRLNKRLYRRVYRLKKAFPTMKSDTISKILELKKSEKKK